MKILTLQEVTAVSGAGVLLSQVFKLVFPQNSKITTLALIPSETGLPYGQVGKFPPFAKFFGSF